VTQPVTLQSNQKLKAFCNQLLARIITQGKFLSAGPNPFSVFPNRIDQS